MKPINKLMKRLSLYLFLILFTLQTPSQADDIRDFQIEGMSIGDSALDYFTKDEIVEELSEFFKNNARKIDKGAIDYISDIKSDTSKIVTVQFIFNSGDAVHVTCYDMQDPTLGATGVEVSTTTREYWKWNNTEAY